jgi:TldD protein
MTGKTVRAPAYERALSRRVDSEWPEPIRMGDAFGVSRADLEKLLGVAVGRGGDYSDLYFEHTEGFRVAIEENIVKTAKRGLSAGMGVRVLAGEKTGYAYTEEFSPARMRAAASQAAYIADLGSGSGGSIRLRPKTAPNYFPVVVAPSGDELDVAVAIVKAANKAARDADDRIREVSVAIASEVRRVLVATTDGDLRYDVRPLILMSVTVIADDGKTRQTATESVGGRSGLERFLFQKPEEVAKTAADLALVQLDADDAPAGPMTVVMSPGWSGVLLHEAVGHGLEADFNRKGLSLYSGRVGEKVASDLCTVVDRGDIPGRRGSLGCDDEGTPTKENVLIENGRLVRYMNDRLSARLMKTEPTGNGRRESYEYTPIPRMTNTYMLSGSSDPEEVIGSVKNGLYADRLGGGQVDITNGNFVFEVRVARMIENGRLTKTLRGATLIGNGPDVLTKVDMVGNDSVLDPGRGVCGKDGQGVPVGVGIPTMRVSEITVGGTSGGGGK